MQKIFELYLERLVECSDASDFRHALSDAVRELDLSLFAYLALPSRRTARPRLISNYPERWATHYLSMEYQMIDPVIVRARSGGCPFQWNCRMTCTAGSLGQERVFDEAVKFDICRGLTIPLIDRRGGFAAMTFAAGGRDATFMHRVEKYEQALQLMATCFHIYVRRRLSEDRKVEGVTLTPREYECLKWASRGKSAWEIGCILGITRRTAAFHLGNAKQKLDVRTTNQAVALFASSRDSGT